MIIRSQTLLFQGKKTDLQVERLVQGKGVHRGPRRLRQLFWSGTCFAVRGRLPENHTRGQGHRELISLPLCMRGLAVLMKSYSVDNSGPLRGSWSLKLADLLDSPSVSNDSTILLVDPLSPRSSTRMTFAPTEGELFGIDAGQILLDSTTLR